MGLNTMNNICGQINLGFQPARLIGLHHTQGGATLTVGLNYYGLSALIETIMTHRTKIYEFRSKAFDNWLRRTLSKPNGKRSAALGKQMRCKTSGLKAQIKNKWH